MGRTPFPPPNGSDDIWKAWEKWTSLKLFFYLIVLIIVIVAIITSMILYAVVNDWLVI